MDRASASMDAGRDVWDWEVLPDHMSSSVCHDGATLPPDDQETMEPMITPPKSSDADVHGEAPVDEFKDIGVVLEDETKPSKEEAMPETESKEEGEAMAESEEEAMSESKEESMPEATNPSASDGGEEEEEEEKTFQSLDTKDSDEGKFDEEQEEGGAVKKKDDGRARPECVVFSVGKLKVNGIGALCSFGVAAATVCILLVGGKLQHHHRQQQQKIQLQFCGDDTRIQQVVQQTSRLNQTMSSVMGGGTSARANISFGGFYDGL